MKKGFFTLDVGEAIEIDTFVYNCHKCGMTFSPVHIIAIPTRIYEYVMDVYQRMFVVKFFNLSEICSCKSNNQRMVWFHDPEFLPHLMFRKDEHIPSDDDWKEYRNATNEAIEAFNEKFVSNTDIEE